MATESVELLALQRIDETCIQLQQQGNYLQALECMERGLVLRQHFFGSDSEEVWSACKVVGEMCNLLAMTYLQQEDFGMVLELLKKAEILTERDDVSKAVTYNNLACYYRRRGKLHAALQYLQKALKIEAKAASRVEHPADTHLNTCAVLSQIGRHQEALEHAQSALILLQEEIFGGVATSLGTAEAKEQAPGADRIAVLAIAYHNMGVEQEFLKKFEHSLQSYRKGVEVAQKYLGGNHAVTITLRNSTVAARRAISVRDKKIREELTRRINRRTRTRNRGGRESSKMAVGTGVLSKALSRNASSHENMQSIEEDEGVQEKYHGDDDAFEGDENQTDRMAQRLMKSATLDPAPPPGETSPQAQDINDARVDSGPNLGDMITPRPAQEENLEQSIEEDEGVQEKYHGDDDAFEGDENQTDRMAQRLMKCATLDPAPPPGETSPQAEDINDARGDSGPNLGDIMTPRPAQEEDPRGCRFGEGVQ